MKLIYSELMGHFSLGNPVEVMDALFNTPILRGLLGERILLYDQLVIPTGNFGIIPVLRLWLGDEIFISLLEKRIISFLKYTGWVAYVGNGGGIQFFKILPDKEKGETFGTTFFRDKRVALDYALKNTKSPSPGDDTRNISNLVLDNTIEIELNNDIADKIRHESYQDIKNSSILRSYLFFRNPELTEIKLNSLKGVGADQLRVFDFHRPYENLDDDISIMLNVAEHNILLFFMSQINDSDVFSDETTGKILKSKIQRFMQVNKLNDDFEKVLNVNGIPDLAETILKGALTFKEIIKIREKSDAKYFREWLHTNSNSCQEDVVKAFVADITKPSIMEKFPIKVIRFGVPNLVGLLNPITGLALDAADSFILDRLVNKRNPKVFLDNLKRVILPPKRM